MEFSTQFQRNFFKPGIVYHSQSPVSSLCDCVSESVRVKMLVLWMEQLPREAACSEQGHTNRSHVCHI